MSDDLQLMALESRVIALEQAMSQTLAMIEDLSTSYAEFAETMSKAVKQFDGILRTHEQRLRRHSGRLERLEARADTRPG